VTSRIGVWLIAVLLGASGCGHIPEHKQFAGISDTLSLRQACRVVAAGLGDTDAGVITLFESTLDSTAAALSRRFAGAADTLAAAAIIDLVYRDWGIQFDPVDSNAAALLPHQVFRQRKGACTGVALLILLLADKLQCPIYGVLLPGHIFCRFDNGTTRFNLEPNRQGFRHPDSYYQTRYAAAARPWYDLHNLTAYETVGVLCYSAGTVALNRQNASIATAFLTEAARRLPWFVEGRGNLALAQAQTGDLAGAEELLASMFRDHPDLPNLAGNYAAVAMSGHHYRTVVTVSRHGLMFFPCDTQLLALCADAYRRLGESDSAAFFTAARRNPAAFGCGPASEARP
jgi:hypothetical protein